MRTSILASVLVFGFVSACAEYGDSRNQVVTPVDAGQVDAAPEPQPDATCSTCECMDECSSRARECRWKCDIKYHDDEPWRLHCYETCDWAEIWCQDRCQAGDDRPDAGGCNLQQGCP